MHPPQSPASPNKRIEAVDAARGLAALIMIQGHAYHAWVQPEAKAGLAYQATRLLGTLPLPAFLLLAGAAVGLRVGAAHRRGEPSAQVRRGLVRRGLLIVGLGYAANFAFAVLDGWSSWDTLLRADVLHAIGLCIALLCAAGLRRHQGPPSLARFGWTAAVLGALCLALCPWLSSMGSQLNGTARYFAALWIDVPGVTRMPFVPLVFWASAGAVAGLGLHAATQSGRHLSPRWWWGLAAVSAMLAFLGTELTTAWVAASQQPLSRSHPAVWLNALELTARAAMVLCAGGLLSQALPESAKRALLRLGQASLVAYIFHLPFCYGSLGKALQGQLTMLEATAAVGLLMAATALVVAARVRWQAAGGLRARFAARRVRVA